MQMSEAASLACAVSDHLATDRAMIPAAHMAWTVEGGNNAHRRDHGPDICFVHTGSPLISQPVACMHLNLSSPSFDPARGACLAARHFARSQALAGYLAPDVSTDH